MYVHIESRPFISHLTVTCIFSFQPSEVSCASDMLLGAHGRVEIKKIRVIVGLDMKEPYLI
jgi:hypothetical protein